MTNFDIFYSIVYMQGTTITYLCLVQEWTLNTHFGFKYNLWVMIQRPIHQSEILL